MGKAVVRVALWLLMPVALLAQNATPKGEIYTGYSFVRIEGTNLHGWNVSLAGNVNRNLAIVGDFAGHYNEERSSIGSTVTDSNLTFHSVMAGPRVADRSIGWLTPFAHALFGMTRINAEATVTQPNLPSTSVSNDTTGFSMVLGGGLDLAMSQSVALRLVQADFLLIRSDGFKHEGARVSAGLVWRLGQRAD